MKFPLNRKTRLILLILVVPCLLLLALSFKTNRQRLSGGPNLSTPERADLSNPGGDPDHDPDSVPSFREAMGYNSICRKRPLTPGEIERVIELAKDRHYSTTAVVATGVLQSIKAPDHHDQIVEALIENLKSPHAGVRASAIAALGSLKVKTAAPLIIPFLSAASEVERYAARSSLKKLGYQIPKQEPNLDR